MCVFFPVLYCNLLTLNGFSGTEPIIGRYVNLVFASFVCIEAVRGMFQKIITDEKVAISMILSFDMI